MKQKQEKKKTKTCSEMCRHAANRERRVLEIKTIQRKRGEGKGRLRERKTGTEGETEKISTKKGLFLERGQK